MVWSRCDDGTQQRNRIFSLLNTQRVVGVMAGERFHTVSGKRRSVMNSGIPNGRDVVAPDSPPAAAWRSSSLRRGPRASRRRAAPSDSPRAMRACPRWRRGVFPALEVVKHKYPLVALPTCGARPSSRPWRRPRGSGATTARPTSDRPLRSHRSTSVCSSSFLACPCPLGAAPFRSRQVSGSASSRSERRRAATRCPEPMRRRLVWGCAVGRPETGLSHHRPARCRFTNCPSPAALELPCR